MLFKHGTVPWNLTPANLLRAAEQDIAVRESNTQIRREKKTLKAGNLPTKDLPRLRKYAFLSAHVRLAKNTSDLLRLALAGAEDGKGSLTVNTRAVYSDMGNLAQAYVMACKIEDSPAT